MASCFDFRRWLALSARCLCRSFLALLVAGVPARAGAEELHPAVAEPPPPEPRKHWYGVETLVTDGVWAALLTGGLLDTAGPYFVGASAIGYSLGAPLIHFAHRRPVEGLASFVLRLPAPLIVGGGTALAYCSREGGDFCGVAGLPPAITLMAAAVVIDAVFLSYEDVHAGHPRPYVGAPLRIVPTLAVTRRDALLGVAITM